MTDKKKPVVDALYELLIDRVGAMEARDRVAKIRGEINAAKETWSATQVRSRNQMVGAGIVVGLLAGGLIGYLAG